MRTSRRTFLAAAALGACGIRPSVALPQPGLPTRQRHGLRDVDSAQASAPARLSYLVRDDVQAFIVEAIQSYGLTREFVEAALAVALHSPQAQRLTTPGQLPASSKNWPNYRARNVDEARIHAGTTFIRQYRTTLARAEARFGVPAEVIAAIIGIETRFGVDTGTFRTLDVLVTLSFDDTRRAAFFRDELAQFLLHCRDELIDPTQVRGSFAGAIGLPQFMPGSIRRHAIDFDRDGRIDLKQSVDDAIGSVANYLNQHGWQRRLPISFAATAAAEIAAPLLGGINTSHTWGELSSLGISINAALSQHEPVLLIDLPGDRGGKNVALSTLYRVGTVNLAAILQYNRSYLYAAAVTDLAEAIRKRTAAAS